MARVKEFFANFKKGLGKLGDKVEKVADSTSLRIKLTAIDSKLDDLFVEFGKLTYEGMRDGVTEETEQRLETLLAIIDGKVAEKKAAEDELARRKEEDSRVKTEHEATAEPAEETDKKETVEPAEKGEESAEETPANEEKPE